MTRPVAPAETVTSLPIQTPNCFTTFCIQKDYTMCPHQDRKLNASDSQPKLTVIDMRDDLSIDDESDDEVFSTSAIIVCWLGVAALILTPCVLVWWVLGGLR